MKKFLRLLPIVIAIFMSVGVCRAQSSYVIDDSGFKWQTFTVNDLDVYVNVHKIRKMGRYLMLTLYIRNNSDSTSYTLDFDEITVVRGGKSEHFYSQYDFERRIKNRAAWNRFGLGMASVATAVTAEVALGSSSWGRNHHRSFGDDLLYGLAKSGIRAGVIAGDIALGVAQENAIEKIQAENLGYLRNYAIKPKSSITGFAYAKYRNTNSNVITVNLPISGKVFSFTLDPSELGEFVEDD